MLAKILTSASVLSASVFEVQHLDGSGTSNLKECKMHNDLQPVAEKTNQKSYKSFKSFMFKRLLSHFHKILKNSICII